MWETKLMTQQENKNVHEHENIINNQPAFFFNLPKKAIHS